MKFTCDSCGAQYMISDEKVGPNGVKVRCKKCSNVILVRRATELAAAPAGAAPSAPSTANGATAPAAGLDAELGQAFDQAFGDPPQPAPTTNGAAAERANGDLAETQLMGAEDAAKVFAAQGGSPAATEWYVAIGQAQVGPLPLVEVKRKWEAGDVGPDSLVWRPGMGDWSPLTSVPDLAGYLAPVPRAAAGARHAPVEPAPREPARSEAQPAAEVTWKPVGASALAALASEEIATRAAPEPRPVAARPAGVKALVDALPDGGGVDPTGALPLAIKALEATGEKKLERRTSVARGAEETRLRRSTTRAVGIGVVLGVVLVAGTAVGGVVLYRRLAPPPAPAAAAAPAPAVPAPAPAAAPPAPEVPASAAPATAAVATAPVSPGAVTAAASPPPVEKAEPPAPPPAPVARAEPPARKEPVRREPVRKAAPRNSTRLAAAPPAPAPTPAPAPAAPARRKGDSLLDFESNDAALDAALGGSGGASARSVYVPPARTGAAPPAKVSTGDINAAVAQRIDSLRRCVSEQKGREPDATGTLKMRWLIQGDGSVRDVKCLTPEYAQGAFAQCIAGVVKTIRFPRSATTGQEVTFPFNF